jgi:hypothetical protein
MIRRPAWIAIVLFILLASVTFFLEKRGTDLPFSKVTPTPTVYKVVLHDESEISKIFLMRNSQEIIATKEASLGWKILTPEDVSDGSGIFQEKFSEILSFKVYRTLPADTSDLSMGTKTQSAINISLEYSDGQKDVILIGDPTPIESGYYARLQNGDAVILNKISVENVADLFSQFYPLPTPPEIGVTITVQP